MAHTILLRPLRSSRLLRVAALAAMFFSATTAPPIAGAQELPLERCDVLPMIEVQIAGLHKWFLVDTAATSMLNLESFATGQARDIHVTSWSGTLATSAKEVTLPDLMVGRTKLLEVKLPAIDLSAIGKACGRKIDGILGVDLLGKLGASITLREQTIHVATADETHSAEMVAAMQHEMHRCVEAFNASDEEKFGDCLDPKIVLFSTDTNSTGANKSSAISASGIFISNQPRSWKSARAPFIPLAKRFGTSMNLRSNQRGESSMAVAWPCAKNLKDIGGWPACITPSQSWNPRGFRGKNAKHRAFRRTAPTASWRFHQGPLFSRMRKAYCP